MVVCFNKLLPLQPNIKLVCSHMAQCTSCCFDIIISYYIIISNTIITIISYFSLNLYVLLYFILYTSCYFVIIISYYIQHHHYHHFIISSFSFNLYIDILLVILKETGIGCHINGTFMGALAYADTISSPSLQGLNCMLDICRIFALDNFIIFL